MSNEVMPFLVWWINDSGKYNARGYYSQRAAVNAYNKIRRSRGFQKCGWESSDRQQTWFRATSNTNPKSCS